MIIKKRNLLRGKFNIESRGSNPKFTKKWEH